MLAFDTSGNVKWSVPNYSPQTLNADGSVSAQSVGGSTTATFDMHGAPAGQLQPTLGYSWLGNYYSLSTDSRVVAVISPPIDYAMTFGALVGGNASFNLTAVKQPEFAQLPSCPQAQTPCAKEAIYAALGTLAANLKNGCSPCQAYVFDKISLKQTDFVTYLQGATFFDGTRSQAKRCGALYKSSLLGCFFDGWTVAYYFGMSGTDLTAATLTPSSPLQTFFRPSAISLDSGGANVLNMATIFHEALHGKTGLYDSDLQKALGCTQQDDTRNITWYLESFVVRSPILPVQACTNYPGHL